MSEQKLQVLASSLSNTNLAKMLPFSTLQALCVCQVGVALCILCVLAAWLDPLGPTQY